MRLGRDDLNTCYLKTFSISFAFWDTARLLIKGGARMSKIDHINVVQMD